MKVLTLRTCDTCRKARRWLDERGISYENVDVRADGVDRETVERVVAEAGPERAVNKRSTTWRNLGHAGDVDADHAVDLIMGEPTLMKRPVFLTEDAVMIGFDESVKAALERRA